MDDEADASRERGAADREQRVGDLSSPGTGPEAIPPPGPLARQRIPPRRIDHTYCDYSRCAVELLRTGKRAAENFPSILHVILSSPKTTRVSSEEKGARAI